MVTTSSAKRPRIDRGFLRVMRDGRGVNASFREITDREFKEWFERWVPKRRPDLAGTELRLPLSAERREGLLQQLEEWGIPAYMFKE
jgi:hypothetical protein